MSVESLSNQTVTISPQGERDKYNKLAYGSPVTYRARFTKTSKTIVIPQNEKEPIDGIVTIPGNPTATTGDKLVYSGVNYRVMAIKEAIGGNGTVHHVTLQVQKWST
jgi:hypothetical protein